MTYDETAGQHVVNNLVVERYPMPSRLSPLRTLLRDPQRVRPG
jgi:hypothetical protein